MTFSSQKDKKDNLEELFNSMMVTTDCEMWEILGNKMDMLVEDLNVFVEQTNELRLLADYFDQTNRDIESVKNQQEKLNESDSEFVGFFTKIPKLEKLTQLKEEIDELEKKKLALEELNVFLNWFVAERGIEAIKKQKRERYNGFIKGFAKRQIEAMQSSLNFWNTVVDDFEGENDCDENCREEQEETIEEEKETLIKED